MKKIKIYLAILTLIFASLSCSLPTNDQSNSGTENGTMTSVAETVIAQYSSPVPANIIPTAADQQSLPVTTEISPVPVSEASQTPTAPLVPTSSNTPQPCNRAQFVKDVTIDDGTVMKINKSFTKVWRLQNTGSCQWTSGYLLVFDHGDLMSGPATQQLTSSIISPGQTVDIPVNLVSPGTAGNYQGFWKIRDQNGETFGVSTGPFYVKIVVIPEPPTHTPVPVLPPPVGLMTIHLVPAESGSVRSNGDTGPVENVGDSSPNIPQQGLLTFDISGLPAGATILSVRVDFSNYDTLGNPFGLGCLRLFSQNFGIVDPSDYVGGNPLGAAARWCSTGELTSVTDLPDAVPNFQSALGNNRIQFRVQFKDVPTNNDGVADMVRFGPDINFLVSFTN